MGIGFVGLEWFQSHFGIRGVLKDAVPMDNTYYESASTHVEVKEANGRKVVIITKNPNYLKSFVNGAIIAFIASVFPLVMVLKREHDASRQRR
jgi:hypothetical protein